MFPVGLRRRVVSFGRILFEYSARRDAAVEPAASGVVCDFGGPDSDALRFSDQGFGPTVVD